jgi:hypothetical protein
MTHWCHDIARDEAVRAAEDGRDRPLPTLGEAIAVARSGMADGDSWRAACESARIASGTIADLTAERDAAIRERDALLESQLWGVNCKPSPPGPEGKDG